MRRFFVLLSLVSLLLVCVAPAASFAAPLRHGLVMSVPTGARPQTSTAVEFRLPKRVAAVDGRLYFDATAAEFVGLAPTGPGRSFVPIDIEGGVAFGAYGLEPSGGHTVMRVVLAPRTTGRIELRLVIDSAADVEGQRVNVRQSRALAALPVGRDTRVLPAPAEGAGPAQLMAPVTARDLVADGRIGKPDLDMVRAGWEAARLNDAVCGPDRDQTMDANGDGCVDIVDVQVLLAAQGRRLSRPPQPVPAGNAPVTFASPGPNFVVSSTADTPDATPGDGMCADAVGDCTLRAAITESNQWPGQNRIDFNLPGTAPVRIQLTSAVMPIINDRSGGLTIDGYSQPGSQPNTLAFGTNAIPGVEIRGTANSPRGNGLRVTSPNNTIRGLLFDNLFHAIVLDDPDAHHNRILGNWAGYNPDGSNHTYRGDYLILLQGGSADNIVGTPALADRNVSGNGRKGVELWGAGTDRNVIQNNIFCTAPNGTTAVCNVAIDLDHGPKHTLVGGTGPNERNVTGRTSNNGIELSHGFSVDGSDQSVTWQVNDNSVIGNWVGFKSDGSYDPAYRAGQNNPGSADNGNGINVYDGSNHNLVEGNWVASVYDGIQTMSSNATDNTIRNNIVGESPLGQPAPLTRRGIVVRLNTRSHVIQGNIVRNATLGGIALTQHDVRFIRISRNIITDTTGKAIHLEPNPGDPTTGANNLLPAPTITSATTLAVRGTGIVGATVEVYRASRLAGESGLPVEYLGSAVVAANGEWMVPSSLQVGDRATALQIALNDDTSELSLNVVATLEVPPPPPVADFDWSQQAGGLTVAFTDTSTGAPTAWNWDFGDGTSSTQQHPTKTYATADDYTVVLTVSNAGGPDSETQTVTVDPLPPAEVVAADAFGRTSTNTWASADVGGAYTLQGTAANFDVGGGVGTVVVPTAGATRSALLGASERDVDVRFRVRTDKVAAGAGYYVYAVTRRNGTNEYRPRIVMHANGTVSVHASVLINNVESSLAPAVVVPGLTQAPNAFIWVRAQVTGTSPTTIRVRAWADGQPEPSGWQFTATNSAAAVQVAGSVGLRLYLTGGVTTAPVLFAFDDYSVTEVPPPPPVADFDWSQQAGGLTVAFTDTSTGAPTAWSWDFGDGTSSTQQHPTKTYATADDYTVVLTVSNAGGPDSETQTVTVDPLPPAEVVAADAFGRTSTNTWASADVGGAYTLQGTAANFNVGGGVGTVVVPTAGATRSALLGASERDVDVRFRVRTDKVAAGAGYYVYAVTRRNGTNEYRPRIVMHANGTVSVHASVLINNVESSLAPAVVVPGLTQAPNAFIWVRAQVTGTSPTTIRVRAWADGQPEPSGWQFTATNSAAAVQVAGSVGLRIYLTGGVTTAPVLFAFDDYSVTEVP